MGGVGEKVLRGGASAVIFNYCCIISGFCVMSS